MKSVAFLSNFSGTTVSSIEHISWPTQFEGQEEDATNQRQHVQRIHHKNQLTVMSAPSTLLLGEGDIYWGRNRGSQSSVSLRPLNNGFV